MNFNTKMSIYSQLNHPSYLALTFSLTHGPPLPTPQSSVKEEQLPQSLQLAEGMFQHLEKALGSRVQEQVEAQVQLF